MLKFIKYSFAKFQLHSVQFQFCNKNHGVSGIGSMQNLLIVDICELV